jgi:AraC family transcriptional regulator, regulatory protein of adaptative response / methylated-DNA-[protein]-cysteine methyltransferase
MNATQILPSPDEMYRAVLERDTRFEGTFVVAVHTTGIFCRPGCPAKTPQRRNVSFFASARAALAEGFRPCLRCRPMERRGATPPEIRTLLEEAEKDPGRRWRDRDLRARGLDPVFTRRWFKAQHGMTFHAYQRARRMAGALDELARGAAITSAAFGNGYDSLSGFNEALRRMTGRTPSRSRDTTVVRLTRFATPLGPVLAGTTEHGVCLLEFTDRRMLETQLRRLMQRLNCVYAPGSSNIAAQLERELDAYFAGTLREFSVPVHTHGSEFQERVWLALRAIPPGETRSYAEQARMIGAPSAVRAVARANGDNRVAIIIPCHRVIGADGRLTGYGGGLWRKQWLLDHERRTS